MLWEIEITPKGDDAERARICDDYDLLSGSSAKSRAITGTSRGYLIEGDLDQDGADRLLKELLVNSLVEEGRIGAERAPGPGLPGNRAAQAGGHGPGRAERNRRGA